MSRHEVVSGDITQFKADGLITAINSGGLWYGGIDRVIQRVAGGLFHGQASRVLPKKHGDTIVAESNGSAHGGAFENVVFVIDDLKGPLHQIIYNGLKAASGAGFKTVSIPAIRTGVMLGKVEKSLEEATRELAKGVGMFDADYPDGEIESITFVVFNDEAIREQLAAHLARADADPKSREVPE